MDAPSETSTLERARAHARAQAGALAATAPTVPATAALDLPADVDAATVVWDEGIGVGGYAARVLRRGTVLRIADPGGDACVQLLAFRADQTSERLNVADTVKVQWQAYLDEGAVLLSGMGRALLTMVADTSARHDCLCGGGAKAGSTDVWGEAPRPRDLLRLAAAKHDLTSRDLPPWINLFKGVRVADDGALALEGVPTPGAFVHLRAELDVLVLLANAPHPLDERPAYEGSAVRCTAWLGQRPDPDPFRATTPERERAFLNTEAVLR